MTRTAAPAWSAAGSAFTTRSAAGWSRATKSGKPTITTAMSARFWGVKTVSLSGIGAAMSPALRVSESGVATSSGTEADRPPWKVAPMPR
jgi:hypothetical protein